MKSIGHHMIHRYTTASALLAGSLLLGGCDDPTDAVARAQVVIETPRPYELTSSDVPEPADDVRIVLDEIHFHRTDGAWVEVVLEHPTATLEFGEAPPTLGEARLPAGEYDQVRLVVFDAEVTIDGEVEPLELDSGVTFGLDAWGTFCVEDPRPESEELALPESLEEPAPLPRLEDLRLRWDAGEGLRYDEVRGYWLTPEVEVEHGPECAF